MLRQKGSSATRRNTGAKPGTATSTVTGSGAVVLSQQPGGIKITSATVGRVIDLGITDSQDMGSAMAPAAADTVKQHLEDLGRTLMITI